VSILQIGYIRREEAWRATCVSNATKRLREQYLNAYMMRKWISDKMARLNYDQIKEIYHLVKDWTGEEMD